MAESSRKRARSTKIDQNKRRKTESASTRRSGQETIGTDRDRKPPVKPKRPLTIFSFPREIRQKILTDSELFENAYKQDVALMNNLTILRHFTQGRYGIPSRIKAPHLASVASTLAAVHPIIREDMSYLLRLQLERIEEHDEGDADRLHDASSPPELYAAKELRWVDSVSNVHPDNGKLFCKSMHYLIASIEPAVIGCWKCWKYKNWERNMKHVLNMTGVIDDSDLEEEMMEDDEWYQHMSNECGCSPVR